VLIPGSGDFSFDWSLVQPEVSRFTRVCTYDFAGFAWSDPGPTPRTMRQDAYELHTLLQAARIKPPYVLIGHSLGGLMTRVYAGEYPSEAAGIVLIDSTHEDTVLLIQGKPVRLRELARQENVPGVQSIKTSPPQPATQQQIDESAERLTKSGAPKIRAPFDKLPPLSQSMRVWALSQPPKVAQSQGFLAEELQAMYLARAKQAYPLGDRPLIILLPKFTIGNPPPGVSTDEWKRINEEKRQQKLDFTNLSRNSKVILAEKSGHHIQLDEPQVVIDSIRAVVEAAKRHTKLR
jgi:pimeloyl-ACP methyl ester carboxylesterase